jgi:glycosyltransferase involved in cell wall biosynthesis
MTQENSSLTNQIVYFDGTFLENKSGVGRDSRNLLSAAYLAYGGSVRVIYPQLRLFTRVVKNSPIPVKSKLQKVLKFRAILTRKAEICRLEKQSIFIQSHLQCIVPAINDQTKYIVRLHDVFPLSNPEWFRWYSKLIFTIGFNNAFDRAVFLCDSLTTQTELHKLKIIDKISSCVALCPVAIPSGDLCKKCTGCKTLDIRQKHVISISTLEPRKNFGELITAWIKSEAFILTRTHLYIVGRKGWKSTKLAKDLKARGPSSGIHWIKNACDESVQELLRTSEFLISTSFGEGFNLSVAEALIQQIPVLISNNQVHTEIYSPDANFYTLKDPNELSKKIQKLLSDGKKSKIDNGHKLLFANYDSALETLAKAIRDA